MVASPEFFEGARHKPTAIVDFKKHLGHKTIPKSLDPIEIYKNLDRASDKGELRTLQKVVLSNCLSE